MPSFASICLSIVQSGQDSEPECHAEGMKITTIAFWLTGIRVSLDETPAVSEPFMPVSSLSSRHCGRSLQDTQHAAMAWIIWIGLMILVSPVAVWVFH